MSVAHFDPPISNWNDLSLTLRIGLGHDMTLEEGDGNKIAASAAINWIGNRIFTFPFSYLIGYTGTAPEFSSVVNNQLTLNLPMARGAGVAAGLISKEEFDKFDNSYPAPEGTVDQYVRGDGSIGTWGQGLTTDPSHNATLDLASKTLVTPVISTTWTLFNTDGTTPYSPATSTVKNVTVDKGVIGHISSTFLYPAPDPDEAVPTSVFGDYGTTIPAPGVPSAVFTNGGNTITVNTTFSETLARAKSGLVVVGEQVQFAAGNNNTSDSTSITFLGRGCMIFSASSSLNAAAIQAVLNTDNFQSTRTRTFNGVTSGSGNYTYYVYDAALGNCTNVIQNGALPVFTAFSFLSNVSITNAAGFVMNVIVMRSNATNAFTAANLAFS